MQKSVILGVCAMLALTAGDADAQWTQPLDGRLTVSVNGGGQAGSTDVARTTTFPLYEEVAQLESSQTVNAGGVFDIGAAYRVGPNWGVGFAYSASGGSGDATLGGSLPHPLFFSQPRPFGTTITGLDTRERAVHLQAVLFVPFIEDIDFTFAAGPSFFTAEQGFVRGVSFSEVPPGLTTVNIDAVDVANLRQSATGFNISGDVTYSIRETIGAGLLLRYTRATVDMELVPGSTLEVRPGGFQVLVGARLRF